jgi:hypothetical protein
MKRKGPAHDGAEGYCMVQKSQPKSTPTRRRKARGQPPSNLKRERNSASSKGKLTAQKRRFREGQKASERSRAVLPQTNPTEPQPGPASPETETNAQAANPPSKEAPPVRRISNAPPPPTEVRGTGWFLSPDPAQTPIERPTDLPVGYPIGLNLRTQDVINRAIEAFPRKSQVLDLCKRVVSELTAAYCAEVQAGRLRPDAAPKAMSALLSVLMGGNCRNSERLNLEQEILGSEEWRGFIRELLESEKIAAPAQTQPMPVGVPVQKLRKPDRIVKPTRDLENLKALRSIPYAQAASEFDLSVRWVRELVKKGKLNKSANRRIITDEKFEQEFKSRHSPTVKQAQNSSS